MTAKFNFDSSGRLKEPTPEEWAMADKDSAIMALSTGKQANGDPYYAYIAVRPSKYAEFYRLSKEHASINLEDYGVIVAAGPEASPPPAVIQRMIDEHGFDKDFEKNLEVELIKQRSEFGAKQEEKRIMDIVTLLKSKKSSG